MPTMQVQNQESLIHALIELKRAARERMKQPFRGLFGTKPDNFAILVNDTVDKIAKNLNIPLPPLEHPSIKRKTG